MRAGDAKKLSLSPLIPLSPSPHLPLNRLAAQRKTLSDGLLADQVVALAITAVSLIERPPPDINPLQPRARVVHRVPIARLREIGLSSHCCRGIEFRTGYIRLE